MTVVRFSFQVSCTNAPKSWFSLLIGRNGAPNSVTLVGVPLRNV